MTKSIMIQGTTSNAGKSIITAGLCRIFVQDGYRVAPFKSQNMALNSYITDDGLEMGRAQVVQAEAARKSPDVRMNPILLKPTSNKSSQVIVNGEVLGNMSAMEYFNYKTTLIPHIMKAFNSLAQENDIIVLEGAGSPAEINLKQQDIVNMGMARLAGAPVLIAGDIDLGGVFASLYGTYMLQDEEEKKYIKGVIINKFRGDVKILEPGLEMLENLIHVPTIGVVPYMQLQIDEEDSLSERLSNSSVQGVNIDIAVIKLPRISNFTDFNAFDYMNGAAVRYVSRAAQLKNPDLIILPGTKNTLDDLKWLRESGLEAAVLKYASEGKPVFGICGGYQMLCRKLCDPWNVEQGGEMAGLGLINAETVFEKQKIRTRVNGRFDKLSGIFAGLSGKSFEGYEIHMGITTSSAPQNHISTLTTPDGGTKVDGLCCNNVYGSYVHGLFDNEEVLNGIAKALMEGKGLTYDQEQSFDVAAHKEREYDKLADTLRKSLDMDKVYRILEEGME
jgi:adenosylcobyric acid synthase